MTGPAVLVAAITVAAVVLGVTLGLHLIRAPDRRIRKLGAVGPEAAFMRAESSPMGHLLLIPVLRDLLSRTEQLEAEVTELRRASE